MQTVLDGVAAALGQAEMPPLPEHEGVFETVLLLRQEPVFFADHWARFERGCRAHGFSPPSDAAEMERMGRALAGENRVSDGVLRFAAWRDGARIRWRVDVGPPRRHQARGEMRLICAGTLPSPTPERAFKNLARRPWREAAAAARAAGADEALLVDGAGCVVEGGVSNLFFLRAGTLCTPALELGPLPGVMRGRVLQLARESGWRAEEEAYPVAALALADEIWMANSLLGLRPVSLLDGRPLPPNRPGLGRFRTAWIEVHGWDPCVILPRTPTDSGGR